VLRRPHEWRIGHAGWEATMKPWVEYLGCEFPLDPGDVDHFDSYTSSELIARWPSCGPRGKHPGRLVTRPFPREDGHRGEPDRARTSAASSLSTIRSTPSYGCATPFVWLNRCGLVPYYVGPTYGRAEGRARLEAPGFAVTDVTAVAHAVRAPVIWLIALAEYLTAPPLQRLIA
jgi:hypothetical protein